MARGIGEPDVRLARPHRLYFSCPQFPLLDLIARIETDFDVPAVSHIGSELYVALKTIGVREPIEGFGRLLKTSSAEPRNIP